MSKTLKLTFIYFKEQLYGLMGGLSKKAKTKTLPAILALLLFLCSAIGFSLYNIARTLDLVNMAQNILIVGMLMAMLMSLMVTLNDTGGTMYKSKDYDMLTSLPLSSVSIITAKYLSTYLISMLYFMLGALPTFVIYYIYVGVNAFSLILGLLSILFMPAFTQLFSCLLGWLVNVLSAKARNKNIVRAVISIILAVGLATFISLANSNIFTSIFAFGTPTWFKFIFSNIYFLFKSITTSNFLYYLAALGVSLGFIVLGILVISIGYKKINSLLFTTNIKGKAKAITYEPKTVYKNLLKKEFVAFFSSPVYCVNGLMGLIMSVVIMVMSITMYYQIGTIPEVANVFTAMMVFGVAMCTGIAPTTSVSVSMEGSKLQTLKSLPIKFNLVAKAKCVLNLILSVPIMIICTIIFSCVIKVDWLVAIVILVYLIVSTISQTVLGLLLNLKFPRLNWTSETQAAKSGASMFLTMFIDMFLSLLPMVLYFVLYFNYAWITLFGYFAICLTIQIIYMFTLIIVFHNKGEQIYNNIQV